MAGLTYYEDGGWNFTCDLCGASRKAGEGVKTWNNLYVCRHHKEKRNPQDFLRGVKDDQSVPWTRPDPPENFLNEGFLREGPGLILQENGDELITEDSDLAEYFFYPVENPGWTDLDTDRDLFLQEVNLFLYIQRPLPTL